MYSQSLVVQRRCLESNPPSVPDVLCWVSAVLAGQKPRSVWERPCQLWQG